MAKRKIGVLGTGDVGRVLGAGFAALGHDVRIGSRDPASEKVRQWVKQAGTHASAGTFADAAAFAEVALVATAWDGTENALRLAGPENFAGKVVMDATNPLRFGAQGELPTLAVGHTTSAGEMVQKWLPGARVVKAFNIVGNAHMVKPDFPGGPPDMFICGNDEQAKTAVGDLCRELGWPTVDMGGIEMSRYLEPLAMLWIGYLFRNGFSHDHAFKLLRKSS
jgi:8-hydroxy-5-deazaflavin:NADPH oxidoreductase